ncbi:MAG: TonB-dependent receptor [Verrucomicrobiales bacterium]
MDQPNSPYDKAQAINLDPSIYGTFAEIGAGQEVANWFFRASATAGTVAKTISAYDMTVSDSIYGKCRRYVSRARMQKMVRYEYDLMVDRLQKDRGKSSRFFSFADTVRARGYQDSAECHGWLGIRYQAVVGGPVGEILLHVRLLDQENVDQMEALGILGLNLIWAAYHHRLDLSRFIRSLSEFITPGRIEIDMLEFNGESFRMVDNRLCALELVSQGLTSAAVFTEKGEVVQPSEIFYKCPLVVLRGSFMPVTHVHLDMLARSREALVADLPEESGEKVREVCELSLSNLLRDGEVDLVSFLDRADTLQALGKTVMVSNCPEFHRIAATLSRFTNERICLTLSIGLLTELFKEKWSEKLAGGILESFGRLFRSGVVLHVYPWKNRRTGEIVTADNFRAPSHLRHLYRHFHEAGLIRAIPCAEEALLEHSGREILRLAREGNPWEELVPTEARELVKRYQP